MSDTKRTFEAEASPFVPLELGLVPKRKKAAPRKKLRSRQAAYPQITVDMILKIIARIQEL